VCCQADGQLEMLCLGLWNTFRISNMGASIPSLEASHISVQYYFNGVAGLPDTNDPLSQYDMDCLDSTIGMAVFHAAFILDANPSWDAYVSAPPPLPQNT
jgi:hypothetical protein